MVILAILLWRKVTSYFSQISNEFKPQMRSATAPELHHPITEGEMLARLKEAKKTSSSVKGDVLPRVMKAHYHKLVKPITIIINAVFREGEWPECWKTESTVLIPKTNNPTSLAECRNISCTPFISKVLESIILRDLREEIPEDDIHYGSMTRASIYSHQNCGRTTSPLIVPGPHLPSTTTRRMK